MVMLSRAVVFVAVLSATLLQTQAIRSREIDELKIEEEAPVFADEEVHMALLAEIRGQIIIEQKAMQDTISDRQGKEAVKSQRERELAEEKKHYDSGFFSGLWRSLTRSRWFSDHYPQLEAAIKSLGEDIQSLKADEAGFQRTIAALTQKLDASAEDAEAALRALMDENSAQIKSKEALLAKEAEEAKAERAEEQQKAKFKVDDFDAAIKEIQAELAALREELKLLMETESLVQLDASHPIHERINKAKAALRKAIDSHGISIDSLAFNIKTEEQSLDEKKLEKAQSLKEFDEAISQLEENIAKAKAAHEKAQNDKAAAETELEQVTKDGKEEVAAWEAELKKQQSSLTAAMEVQQDALANQRKANKEVMEALLDAQEVQHNQLDQEIKQLQAANVQIQETLDKVLAKHAAIKKETGV